MFYPKIVVYYNKLIKIELLLRERENYGKGLKGGHVAERDNNNTNNINQQLIARKTTHCALRGIEG